MPVALTSPGVYIEEVPSGVHTITGVSTSVTAFVGYTTKGPVDTPVRVFNFGEFESQFGGLATESEVSYAVWQYFLNGGSEAWIVRTADGVATASVTLKDSVGAGGNALLQLSAKSPGAWGNLLQVDVDYACANPSSRFNLSVTEYRRSGGALVAGRQESFRNLTMNDASPDYVVAVLGSASQLVSATRLPGAAAVTLQKATSVSVPFAFSAVTLDTNVLRISVDGKPAVEVEIFSGSTPPDATALANAIQTKVNAAIAPASVAVTQATASGMTTLTITSPGSGGSQDQHSAVTVTPASQNDISRAIGLGLAAGGMEIESASAMRPLQTGTVGTVVPLSYALPSPAPPFTATLGGTSVTLSVPDPAPPTDTLAERATLLETMLHQADPTNATLTGARVHAEGGALRVVTASSDPSTSIAFTGAAGVRKAFGLDGTFGPTGSNKENVQAYGLGTNVAKAAQAATAIGVDGNPPNDTELIGSPGAKTGIYALENVDIFNLLCIPRTASFVGADANKAKAVLSAALAYAAKRRAFLLVDPPADRQTVSQIQDWVTGPTGFTPTPDSKNAALYFPPVTLADPLNDYRDRAVPPSGTVAGIYARIDATRGVWKAPAGTEAALSNLTGFQVPLTNDENGVLNQIGVNCLRFFPGYGHVTWGARTMLGSDVQASEWKYVPIRRLALYIEESLYRGTQWAVFEPNDEPLWSQLRLNVGAFMHGLYRRGAFQGPSPAQAYFVKCDGESTTQDDRNRGVVNVVVGFAPLKPAEFVVIQIQQMAGQIET